MNKVNGNQNILSKEQEHQRLQIVDLELKARYWEAQWKIRFYTLEAEKLQPDYDAYIADQQIKQQEMMKRFQEQIEEMNKKAQEEAKAKEDARVLEANEEFLNPLTKV